MKFDKLVQLIEAKKPVVKTAEQLYQKAKKLKKRLPTSEEHVIAQDSKWAYRYAQDVIKGRWPEAEPVIAQYPKWAYNYAKDICHRRFIIGEPLLVGMGPYLEYLNTLNLV